MNEIILKIKPHDCICGKPCVNEKAKGLVKVFKEAIEDDCTECFGKSDPHGYGTYKHEENCPLKEALAKYEKES